MSEAEIMGLAGRAELVTGRPLRRDQDETIAAWLLKCPGQAIWSDYLVCVIHLYARLTPRWPLHIGLAHSRPRRARRTGRDGRRG